MKKNHCYTYFKIVGDFNPFIITELLNIEPEESWNKGDKRRDGSLYTFSMWSCGRCDEYDPYVENQMRKTIELLKDKVDILNKIRNDYDVEFYLEIVPEVYAGGINPCLAPSLDIIDFCHLTRTKIDIDLYVY